GDAAGEGEVVNGGERGGGRFDGAEVDGLLVRAGVAEEIGFAGDEGGVVAGVARGGFGAGDEAAVDRGEARVVADVAGAGVVIEPLDEGVGDVDDGRGAGAQLAEFDG